MKFIILFAILNVHIVIAFVSQDVFSLEGMLMPLTWS